MLREIHIKNFALIDELSLEFKKGFTVFTGETGAGKSILVGAISLLLGERASLEMVRSGTDEADVSGIFEVNTHNKALIALLRNLDIEPIDNTLIIRRKVTRSDRNKIMVNQVPLPLSSLKQIGDLLVDLHGQHEHQSLLAEETHTSVIDSLPVVRSEKAAYDVKYAEYYAAKTTFDSFLAKSEALAERKEMLEFQYKELSVLALKGDEEEALEGELRLLSSSAERSAAAIECSELLGSGNDSIEKRVASVKRKLEILARYDPSVEPWLIDIENVMSVCTELETFCGSYLERIGHGADPARIEQINARLARIQRLKKKFNCTLAGLIDKTAVLHTTLESIENIDADREELVKKRDASLFAAKKAGLLLRAARKKASAVFDQKVSGCMKRLGFNGGCWQTGFTEHDDPEPHGLEQARFMVQTNPGEPIMPLVKCASGGEISRLMLAIKTVMSEHDRIEVLIFDEIDTGIGGVLAKNVAEALLSLSTTHQVLCISHLHQIASRAENHFHVFKEEYNNRTVTKIDALSHQKRVDEIARMLGGDSTIARQHAAELLTNS